jgi:hypothetical protein
MKEEPNGPRKTFEDNENDWYYFSNVIGIN